MIGFMKLDGGVVHVVRDAATLAEWVAAGEGKS